MFSKMYFPSLSLFFLVKILNDYFPPLLFRPLFWYKKPQEKFISECKTKWAYKHKKYEDMDFKDLIIKPETNITGKLARRKHVSRINLLLFWKYFYLRYYNYNFCNILRKNILYHNVNILLVIFLM